MDIQTDKTNELESDVLEESTFPEFGSWNYETLKCENALRIAFAKVVEGIKKLNACYAHTATAPINLKACLQDNIPLTQTELNALYQEAKNQA